MPAPVTLPVYPFTGGWHLKILIISLILILFIQIFINPAHARISFFKDSPDNSTRYYYNESNQLIGSIKYSTDLKKITIQDRYDNTLGTIGSSDISITQDKLEKIFEPTLLINHDLWFLLRKTEINRIINPHLSKWFFSIFIFLVLLIIIPPRRLWLAALFIQGCLTWIYFSWIANVSAEREITSIIKQTPPWMVTAVFIALGILAFFTIIYFFNHVYPRAVRWWQDFFKIDIDAKKKEQLDIEKLVIKTINFSLRPCIEKHIPTEKYFLSLSDNRNPILIEEKKLLEHVHILGGSGTGKTSFAVIPLAEQAIRKGHSVILIDFKGDEQAVKYLASLTSKEGRSYYFFTLHPDIPSNTYNPLSSGNILSKVERVLTALELIFHGEAKFYTYVQQAIFIPLLKAMETEGITYTLSDVYHVLKDPNLFDSFVKDQDIDRKQFLGLTSALTAYAELNILNQASSDIHLDKVMQEKAVCYFDLRSAVNPELSSALGKMIALDLQAHAAARTQRDPICFVFIDEFQNMACRAFTNIVAKVRSANFSLILANQALGDLSSIGEDFLNIVFTNTATKIIFNIEHPDDARLFSEKSGKVVYQSRNIHQFDKKGLDRESTILDGKRSTQGSISDMQKCLIDPNVFLKLPFGKSVIFRRGELAVMGNHAHLLSLKEKYQAERNPWPCHAPVHSSVPVRTLRDYIAARKSASSACVLSATSTGPRVPWIRDSGNKE